VTRVIAAKRFIAWSVLLLILTAAGLVAWGEQGAPGPRGPTGQDARLEASGTSVEGCVGCGGAGVAVPVASITTEGDAHCLTHSGADFQKLGNGSYSYTPVFDPSTGDFPAQAGESMRVAIQLSAGDIPGGNGWCDFDAAPARLETAPRVMCELYELAAEPSRFRSKNRVDQHVFWAIFKSRALRTPHAHTG